MFLVFRRSKVAESPLPDEFCVEEDDIINDSCSPIPQQALFSAPQGQSQPVGKLFVERTSEFITPIVTYSKVLNLTLVLQAT